MITHKRLLEVCLYDPKTGILSATVRRGKVLPGKALGCKSGYGRLIAEIDGQEYRVHRLAWFYVYGEWPKHEIDHINGDPSDNRLCNLREATHQQNMSNIGMPKTNRSGKIGVSWHAKGRKWQAHIKVGGVNKYLGLFETVDEAHSAYMVEALSSRGDFIREQR